MTPGECPHELSAVDVGGGKSECALMGCWTNCREVGRCTWEQTHSDGNQMTIFDALEER